VMKRPRQRPTSRGASGFRRSNIFEPLAKQRSLENKFFRIIGVNS
jgi:hypothetical protein